MSRKPTLTQDAHQRLSLVIPRETKRRLLVLGRWLEAGSITEVVRQLVDRAYAGTGPLGDDPALDDEEG